MALYTPNAAAPPPFVPLPTNYRRINSDEIFTAATVEYPGRTGFFGCGDDGAVVLVNGKNGVGIYTPSRFASEFIAVGADAPKRSEPVIDEKIDPLKPGTYRSGYSGRLIQAFQWRLPEKGIYNIPEWLTLAFERGDIKRDAGSLSPTIHVNTPAGWRAVHTGEYITEDMYGCLQVWTCQAFREEFTRVA